MSNEATEGVTIALRKLVSADACGYHRSTMRYCGFFQDGRTALAKLDGVPVAATEAPNDDPLVRALQAIATFDVSSMTYEESLDIVGRMQLVARNALDTTTW